MLLYNHKIIPHIKFPFCARLLGAAAENGADPRMEEEEEDRRTGYHLEDFILVIIILNACGGLEYRQIDRIVVNWDVIVGKAT